MQAHLSPGDLQAAMCLQISHNLGEQAVDSPGRAHLLLAPLRFGLGVANHRKVDQCCEEG